MNELPKINAIETGENLKRLLRLNHMSVCQLQMALKIGSATPIYRWCRGEYLPSVEHFLQISKILGCTIEDIIVVEE